MCINKLEVDFCKKRQPWAGTGESWVPVFFHCYRFSAGFTLRVSSQASIAAGSLAIAPVLQAGRTGESVKRVPYSSFSPINGVFLETLPNNSHLNLMGYPWLQRRLGNVVL